MKHWRFLTGPFAWVVVFALGVFGNVAAAPLEGYPTEVSVLQGDVLELHVRCQSPTYYVSVWRQGRTLDHVANIGYYDGQDFPIPAQAWQGCNWPVTCSIPVPSNWRPGAYVVRLDAVVGSGWIPFVVRSRQPGSCGPILVQLSIDTWQAYNRYGGKSLYGAYDPGLVGRADHVSFHRPYNFYDAAGSGQFFVWEAPFITFLESLGYDYEVCTNVDVHREPDLLEHYRLFCSVGHDEYYSKEMYDALERFVNNGGNLAFFSGNTLWWQIRLEDNEHTIVCYKNAGLDPILRIDPSRVTTNWHANPVLRPPARLMGTFYNGSNGVPVSGYQIVDPKSWVFHGTQVDSGQVFGSPMVGFEVDARTPDSPPGVNLIARIELPDHNDGDVLRPCEMVYYERTPAYGFALPHGGKVFSCGSVMYMYGLVPAYNTWVKVRGVADPVAQTITVNVLDRFGGQLSVPEPTAPTNSQIVRGVRLLLLWRAARAQRLTAPVHYTVFSLDANDHLDSLKTDQNATWLSINSDRSPYRWWVQAESDWGITARSDPSTFVVDAVSGAGSNKPPPVLAFARQKECISILVWSEGGTAGTVELFDVQGHTVRRFDRTLASGLTRIDWDLRDSRGAAVASGVYLVNLKAGALQARQKVTYVR